MTLALLNYDAIAARYRQMRKVGLELNHGLSEYVSRAAIESTGKKLGMWWKGTLVFDNEDQASVLFDQAIHGFFTNGRNAVDDYLADHPPEPGSDQEAVLAAYKRSYYSLFVVENVLPRVGVRVHDILRDRQHLIADMGFSQSAVKGMTLATRVMPFENFLMTGGAVLPADADTLANIFRLPALKGSPQDIEGLSMQEMADIAAAIIRL